MTYVFHQLDNIEVLVILTLQRGFKVKIRLKLGKFSQNLSKNAQKVSKKGPQEVQAGHPTVGNYRKIFPRAQISTVLLEIWTMCPARPF